MQNTYDFILNDYIKFHSGRFHTSSLAIIETNNKQILYNHSNKSKILINNLLVIIINE